VQTQFVRSIRGFENAHITRAGYAIEYDYFDPQDLHPSLETKHMPNLFFAGQINGTTGYEEAACQGLMAGINASRRVQKKEPIILKRSEAYIGVLIDDLVSKGTNEPYRMFTSRAEHRIILRHDNADLRLMDIGKEIGLINESVHQEYLLKKKEIDLLIKELHNYSVKPEIYNTFLVTINSSSLNQSIKLPNLLTRPEISLNNLITIDESLNALVSDITNNDQVIEQAEIQIKYAGYIQKEFEMVSSFNRQESLKIPLSINYGAIHSLSAEAVQKLNKVKPETIGQASRISGVNPSDIAILMVYIKN